MSVNVLKIAESIKELSVSSQSKIQEVLKMDGLKMMNPYEARLIDGTLICVVCDYSLSEAEEQSEDISEAFDCPLEQIIIKQIPYMTDLDGTPAYKLIYECENEIPQRIFDVE